MSQRTLFPRSPKQWSSANYRLDMQGPAKNGTCYNLQVQRNTNPKKKKTGVSCSISTVALCIAAEDASPDDIKTALLDSVRHEGAERTAGTIPEDEIPTSPTSPTSPSSHTKHKKGRHFDK
ncbi:hypothetical protein BGX34_002470 [Mortierella sp. NVP85]|nr:hypothetical protein BGX34_002470 [Mortierella sp. NVP85]